MGFVKRGDRGKVQHQDGNRLRDGGFAVMGAEAGEFGPSEGFIAIRARRKGCIVGFEGGIGLLGTGGCEGVGNDGKGEEGDVVFLRKTEGCR